MNANVAFFGGGFPDRSRLIVVNGRVPRTDGHCALCGRIVENSYVRDLRTRLIYCDTQCFPAAENMVMPMNKNRARKVS